VLKSPQTSQRPLSPRVRVTSRSSASALACESSRGRCVVPIHKCSDRNSSLAGVADRGSDGSVPS
jgi:hypothetical protein